MTLQEVIDYEKRDSYEEGVEIGRAEGIELGRSEGIELGRSEDIELGRSEGIKLGIQSIISACRSLKQSQLETRDLLSKQFNCSKEKADEYINLYW